MLYHWHELDVVSSAQPIPIRFNKNEAIAAVFGGASRLRAHPDNLTPCNDVTPDVIARRLADMGIGSLNDPDHEITTACSGFGARFQMSMLRRCTTYATRLLVTMTGARGRSTASGRHTIDANNSYSRSDEADDAQRPRLRLAGTH